MRIYIQFGGQYVDMSTCDFLPFTYLYIVHIYERFTSSTNFLPSFPSIPPLLPLPPSIHLPPCTFLRNPAAWLPLAAPSTLHRPLTAPFLVWLGVRLCMWCCPSAIGLSCRLVVASPLPGYIWPFLACFLTSCP